MKKVSWLIVIILIFSCKHANKSSQKDVFAKTSDDRFIRYYAANFEGQSFVCRTLCPLNYKPEKNNVGACKESPIAVPAKQLSETESAAGYLKVIQNKNLVTVSDRPSDRVDVEIDRAFQDVLDLPKKLKNVDVLDGEKICLSADAANSSEGMLVPIPLKPRVDGDFIELRGHTAPVYKVSFSPDGKYLVSASKDGTSRIWETADWNKKEVVIEHGEHPVTDASFSSDGENLMTVSDLIRTRTHLTEKFNEFSAQKNFYRAVFHPKFKSVILACRVNDNKCALLTNDANPRTLFDIWNPTSNSVTVSQFSADGRKVVLGGLDEFYLGEITNDWKVGALKTFKSHPGRIYDISFSPQGDTVLTASSNREVKLTDIATGKEIKNFLGHGEDVYTARFSGDGSQILTASGDQTARLWDVSSGKNYHVFKGHKGIVYGAVFSPDSKWVATASEDKMIRIWRVPAAP